MFEENNQIIKIYGTNKLFSIKEAFRIGKLKLEFREFDKTRQSGDKTTNSVDIYMDIEKFTYLCEMLKTGRIYGIMRSKISEQQKKGLKKPEAAIQDYGGRTADNGSVVSRVLNITNGDRFPIIVTASEGPGKKGANRQIIPDYSSWNKGNSKSISIAMSDEMAVQIGIAGERALRIYDMWVAAGTVEENLTRIDPARRSDIQDNRVYDSQGYQGYTQNPQGYAAQPQNYQRQPAQQGYTSQPQSAQSYNTQRRQYQW